MARTASKTLTGREAEIMDVLWRMGEATADQIRGELSGDPHDSTVRTLLRVLETKKYVKHVEFGKAYLYKPAAERTKAQKAAISGVLKQFFEGSAEQLVLRLIEDEHITPEQLEQLRKSRLKTKKSKSEK